MAHSHLQPPWVTTDPATIDIKHLRYFVGVVDAGSLTRGAAMLHIAQPALTNRIKRLEDELGVQLLVRSAHGVQPTEEGKVLYATARRLVRELADVADYVRTRGRNPSGQVTIGCLHSAANLLAVPLIGSVLSDLPQVKLAFVSGQSKDLFHRLRMGELDLAIIFGAAGVPDVTTRALIHETLLLAVAASQDPFPGRDRINVSELSTLKLILPAASVFSVHELVRQALKERSIDVPVVAEVDCLNALTTLVAQGRGASVLPWAAIGGPVEAGDVVVKRIDGAAFERTTQLCRPAGRDSSSATDAVERLTIQTIASLMRDDAWRYARLEQLPA